MRVLVYKRTHDGDPDDDGVFGAQDCMGQVRKRDVDSVIGIGGIGREPERNCLAGTVNWIGIGPHNRAGPPGWNGPLITYDRFVDFRTEGPDLRSIAPALARRFYSRNTRHKSKNFTEAEQAEIEQILSMAQSAPPSPAHRAPAAVIRKRCKRKRHRKGC